MHQLFANNVQNATLAAGISAAALSMQLTAGEGALLPAITEVGEQFFVLTLNSATNPAVLPEIVQVTNRVTDTLTIVRAQEGTAALAWNAGDLVTMDPTAGSMAQMVQPDVAQAQPGNYILDTGAANAYIANIQPALGAHVVGMPIRVKAAHGNNGPSTFTDGFAPAALQLPGGAALAGGEIIANAVFTAMWTGAYFELIDGAYATPAQLAAAIAACENFALDLLKFSINEAANGVLEIPTEFNTFLVNWGIAVGVNGGAGPVNVTFALAFPNFCVGGQASSKRGLVGTVGTGCVQNLTGTAGTTMSTTGMIVVCDRDADGVQRAYWWAMGW